MSELNTVYDVVIIGGGPAGLSCALYASRYSLSVLVITPKIGGQIADSAMVENYPGTIKDSGFNMMEQWKKHAATFGTQFVTDEIIDVVVPAHDGDNFIAKSAAQAYAGKSIMLATGARHRSLGVPGEHELHGRGVSSCPTCDGFFFTGKIVAVIGGGDAALRGVQVMTQYASKVYLIHRRDELRGEPILIQQMKEDPKVEFLLKKNIKKIIGDTMVTGVELDDGSVVSLDGVFVEIGSLPNNQLALKLGAECTKEGLIKVTHTQSTTVPGVFAGGDVTNGSNSFRQVVTAASEGAIAAESIFSYVKNKHHGAF